MVPSLMVIVSVDIPIQGHRLEIPLSTRASDRLSRAPGGPTMYFWAPLRITLDIPKPLPVLLQS